MKLLSLAAGCVFSAATLSAQQPLKTDSVTARSLDSIVLTSYLGQQFIKPLPATHGTWLLAGIKTESIDLGQAAADLSNKTGRQLFSKIPGIFVYDMDGSGNQVNIAARGLDPHRGWEFNLRKDGILTNSDMYGYPASHYSMPMESISRIELIRGTGSLQYGAQFGGMINYITKQGDTSRPVSFESINSAGSFHLLSTYQALAINKGKFRIYSYLHKKSRGGYRDNEHTDAEAEAIIINFTANARFSIRAEWTRSMYRYRIPGPLTDSQFHADPRQASRSRNYFSPDIHVPSIKLNWQLSPATLLQLTTSAVLGRRNSVMYDKPTNIHDTINLATHEYNNRQVDIDRFNSYTTELRMVHEYRLGHQNSTVAAGVMYMNNDLHRTQLGKGTTGSDYDLALVTPGWGRDVHLRTGNIALYANNKFQLTSKLSVNVGARVESGRTDMSGTIVYYPDNAIPVSIAHHFPLFGANLLYKAAKEIELYGGWSQAYHPMLFKDLIPGSLFEKVDPAIRDASGYNAEFGCRGSWRFLRWDINGFLLGYDNRFGSLAMTDSAGNFYTYRTNIGNSFTKGIEALIQGDWLLANKFYLSVYSSTAITNARYTDAAVKSGNSNISIRGNKVETVPNVISRNGASLRYRKFGFSILYSYTASSFADALNTVTPAPATGAVGLVPAYSLLDLHASYRCSRNVDLRVAMNNALDKQYFTKRPSFYPGPGVWPSDGRNVTMTVIVRL